MGPAALCNSIDATPARRTMAIMVCELIALVFSSPDPERLAGFWGGLLGQEVTIDRGAPSLSMMTEVGFSLRFIPGGGEKRGPNQMHPDLNPTSLHEQASAVHRALDLGARLLDVGQGRDATHVVLADPDGNELCILEPGGLFLAGCPFFSSLAGAGLAEVGYFWRDALSWNLVWDQDGETAVQAFVGEPQDHLGWRAGGVQERRESAPSRPHALRSINRRRRGRAPAGSRRPSRRPSRRRRLRGRPRHG